MLRTTVRGDECARNKTAVAGSRKDESKRLKLNCPQLHERSEPLVERERGSPFFFFFFFHTKTDSVDKKGTTKLLTALLDEPEEVCPILSLAKLTPPTVEQPSR